MFYRKSILLFLTVLQGDIASITVDDFWLYYKYWHLTAKSQLFLKLAIENYFVFQCVKFGLGFSSLIKLKYDPSAQNFPHFMLSAHQNKQN